jgi:recombination protein RecT
MADPKEKPKTMREVLESVREQIAAVCPPSISPDRVIKMALLAAHKNPSIAKSTPASVVFSVMQIAAWGLEIGRTAHLVPFFSKKESAYICQPMPDFKGLVQMMVQSGEVMKVDGRVVREGDTFEVEYGLEERLVHRPIPANDGEIIAAYAVLSMPNGDKKFDVMWRAEIEKVRAVSRSKDDGPWVQWYDQQAIKTVLKRISKQVPLTERTREVIEADNAEYVDADATAATDAAPKQRGKSQRLAALTAGTPNELDQFEQSRDAQGEPVGDEVRPD